MDLRQKARVQLCTVEHPIGNTNILLHRNGWVAFMPVRQWRDRGFLPKMPKLINFYYRPGALLAGCWASLMSQGDSGYVAACHAIVGTAKKIERGIRENLSLDLHIMGNPIASVVAFSSKTLNIYEVGDRMTHRGWELNGLQKPPALHIACTMLTISAVDSFLQDLGEVVSEVKLSAATAIAQGIKPKEGDMAALYGVAGTRIGGHLGIVPRLAEAFVDALYKA
jgi:sphinganine-1-phosphate aldolase